MEKRYVICMDNNGHEIQLEETNDLERATEVYEQTEKLCEMLGKFCWLKDTEIGEDIKYNY